MSGPVSQRTTVELLVALTEAASAGDLSGAVGVAIELGRRIETADLEATYPDRLLPDPVTGVADAPSQQ